jgi:hypothetical protein
VCGECTEGPKVEVDRWVSSTAGNTLKTLSNGNTKPKVVCKSCRPHVRQDMQQRRHNERAVRARVVQQVALSLPEYEVAQTKWLHNEQLEYEFESYRQEFLRKFGGRSEADLNERELFHWSRCIADICANGFEPRFARSGEYGEGAYFAEHAIYSLAYSKATGQPEEGYPWFVPTEPGTEIELLWARCTLGNCKDFKARCSSHRGHRAAELAHMQPGLVEDWDSNRRLPPPLDPAKGRRAGMYESVTGTEGDLQWTDSPRLQEKGSIFGRQYVTFDRRQALPVALIRLKARHHPEEPKVELEPEPEPELPSATRSV